MVKMLFRRPCHIQSCFLNVEEESSMLSLTTALFRSKTQKYNFFVNRLHGVLNVVKKIALHKWTLNRKTNLMSLIMT